MPKIDDLQFVRVIDPAVFAVIPRHLFEQIKELDEEAIDAIYANAVNIMTIPVVNKEGMLVGRYPKQNVWVVALHDVGHQIKGFLWFDIDVIDRLIFVKACSVAKEYQSNNGEVTKRIRDYLANLPFPFKKIMWATIKPGAFERRGWVRSKRILMETQNEVTKSNNKSS